ncbi:hypothetical protein ACC692_38230, partial [Rhizobium ruizarguesonis]
LDFGRRRHRLGYQRIVGFRLSGLGIGDLGLGDLITRILQRAFVRQAEIGGGGLNRRLRHSSSSLS